MQHRIHLIVFTIPHSPTGVLGQFDPDLQVTEWFFFLHTPKKKVFTLIDMNISYFSRTNPLPTAQVKILMLFILV